MDKKQADTETDNSRKCGGCSVCCFIGAVRDLRKGPHQKCFYENNGCDLYGSKARPPVCSAYQCSWLRGIGLPEDRPDISGVMCSQNHMNGGTWIFVIETKPNAVMTSGKKMVERLTTLSGVPVVIADYESKPPDDKGDRVIVKDSLKARSKKIIGELVGYLDKDKTMGIYNLIVN